MSDLGHLLRKARTEKEITLDQLQELTKIRKRYLDAIEQGKYEVLPGNFYVRAFIKQFAEAVGLDPDEVFRLYAHSIPTVDLDPIPELNPKRRQRNYNSPDRAGKWASLLLLIAFPVLIFGVIYYYVSSNGVLSDERIVENPPLTEQRITVEPSVEKSLDTGLDATSNSNGNTNILELNQTTPSPEPPTPPISGMTATVTFAETMKVGNQQIERYEVRNADQVVLDLKVTGKEVWVGISDANKKNDFLFQGRLVQNDALLQTYDHNVFMNVGRANALELVVNGVPIDMGIEPNPRKIQIDRVNP